MSDLNKQIKRRIEFCCDRGGVETPELLQAALERIEELEAQNACAAPKVKPLEWYEKPEGQEVRIGRCGQIAYSVSFKMGSWGYTRRGDNGHCISYVGGRIFRDEADAMNGANEDHIDRILSALTPETER